MQWAKYHGSGGNMGRQKMDQFGSSRSGSNWTRPRRWSWSRNSCTPRRTIITPRRLSTIRRRCSAPVGLRWRTVQPWRQRPSVASTATRAITTTWATVPRTLTLTSPAAPPIPWLPFQHPNSTTTRRCKSWRAPFQPRCRPPRLPKVCPACSSSRCNSRCRSNCSNTSTRSNSTNSNRCQRSNSSNNNNSSNNSNNRRNSNR